MSKSTTTYIGLDVHKEKICAATKFPGRGKPVVQELTADFESLRRFIGRVRKKTKGKILACYEAGPSGYVVCRQLQKLGVECRIVAPSMIPTKPGDRIKTDRRDALKLMQLLKADMLTAIHVPTPDEEAVRELCRARENAREDATKAKQRLAHFLQRRGIRYTVGKTPWTKKYRNWLAELTFEREADKIVFDDLRQAVETALERVEMYEAKITKFAQLDKYQEKVGRLRCMRGIDTVSAMTIVTELPGIERFESASQLMAYLGLVPSEYSSGSKTRRHAITKAGNRRVRRILIEAAWHYSRNINSRSVKLAKRREGQSTTAIALAKQAEQRLRKRWFHLVLSGKPRQVATTAVARELAGFVWASLLGHTTRAAPPPKQD